MTSSQSRSLVDVLPGLNLHLYARPPALEPGKRLLIQGCWLPSVACDSVSQSQFEASFEQVAASLGTFERLFFELDGSLVWTGRQADDSWQIDGMIYDRGNHIQRVEIRGNCTREAWQAFLTALGWPQQPILAHLLEHYCFVEVDALFALWPEA